MTTYAVLLRGINVGGARSIPMAALRTVLTDAGFGDVRTYLQSGNVVVSSRKSATAVADAVEREIGAAFGHDVTVMVRTGAELAAVVAANPFARPDADPRRLMVAFLREPPAAERAAALEARVAPPEAVHVAGCEVYLWLPDGMGRSKIAPAVERTLKAPMTARNWNTVAELAAMT